MESHSNSRTLGQYVNCTFEHSDHKLDILFESKIAHLYHQSHGACSGVGHRRNIDDTLESSLPDTKVDYPISLTNLSHLSSGQ